MKLIYLANARIPTEKAHGLQIMKMCQAFNNLGLELELVAAKRINPQFRNVNPFEYYGIPEKFPIKRLWLLDMVGLKRASGKFSSVIQNISFALSAFFYVLFKKADIIYSRDEFSLFLLSFFRKNLIFEMHTFPKGKISLYKRLFKKTKNIVVINSKLKELVVGLGIPANKVLTAYDGVDLKQFDIKESKKECRQKLDLSLDKKLVIYTGHLFKWKGVYTLARASQFLDDDCWVILIGGMETDIKRMGEFIQDNKLSKVIIIGHQPPKEIPYWLKAADVLVLPNSAKKKISRLYTSPIKMFEYMVSKRPIIASALPSIKEVLNQDNAFLIEPDNPRALANGIERSLKKTDFSDKLSKQAFEDVKQYTWIRRAEKISDFCIRVRP